MNARGVGQIWMVTVRVIRIGESEPAPLFAVVAAPSEDSLVDGTTDGQELRPAEFRRRNFMAALFQQARDEGIASPFKSLTPNANGLNQTSARGSGLLYRVAVNRQECRVVVTNARNRWVGALDVLVTERTEIDRKFAEADLNAPEWPEQATEGRWWIRYTVAASYEDEPDLEKLREINKASELIKRVFGPSLNELDPQLEESSP